MKKVKKTFSHFKRGEKQMGKGMKSSHKAILAIAVVLVVAFLLVTPNPVSNWLGSVTGGTAGGEGGIFGPPEVGTEACGYAPTQKLTVTNEATGANITALQGELFRNGALDGNQLLSTSASFSVDKGEAYKWHIGNTNPNTATYYPFFTTEKTGTCTTNGANAFEIRATGTVTSTITNDNGSTVNDTADRTTAQAFSAGETQNIKVEIKGTTQYAWFGGPDATMVGTPAEMSAASKVAMCADFNTNAIANITATSDRGITEISKPYGVRAVDTTNSLGIKCWQLDGTIGYNERANVYLAVEASSTVNPSLDCNVNLRIMDQILTQRSDNGAYVPAYYDPVTDNTAIGGTDRTDSIGIS